MFHLFHYSAVHFDEIRCLALQPGQDRKQIKQQVAESMKDNRAIPYPYSTSFFFEQIPLDIAKHFPKDHKVWRSGQDLYEYRVNVTPELAKYWLYEVVESDASLEFLKNHGYPETDEQYAAFFMQRNQLKRDLGELGVGYAGLEAQFRKHVGRLADDFKNIIHRNGMLWDENKYKYAACVPHVMIQARGKDPSVDVIPIVPASITRIRLK